MPTEPKYAIAEVERKWLVAPGALSMLDDQPYHEIEDLYVAWTRLRLRKMTNADGVVVYKFCKKYGKRSALSEPITNLYLTEKEYQALSSLDGDRMHKRRYGIAGGAIDVIEGEPAFAVFEVEFESEREAEEYLPPPFAGEEITGNHAYTGAAIAARLRTPRRRCDR